ncbi:MAG TPA: hypothetical protein EYP79_04160 [Campylobacterales bacterium]|nr:hypothetical protein [Campylobacterales bacterium]
MNTIHIRIIAIILEMIQYKNKRLLLELIKAELINNCEYLTELAMIVLPKSYHAIQKIFNRVRFDYIAIQITVIFYILKVFDIKIVIIPIEEKDKK